MFKRLETFVLVVIKILFIIMIIIIIIITINIMIIIHNIIVQEGRKSNWKEKKERERGYSGFPNIIYGYDRSSSMQAKMFNVNLAIV